MKHWKKYKATEYFSDLQIPETWDTIEDFVEWYMQSKMPLMIPWDAEVIRTDDATAICIFKKPPYMIELYLIHPGMSIPYHAHPDMEVITMSLGGGSMAPKNEVNTSVVWGETANKLNSNEYHGGETFIRVGNGYSLLAFEKWLDPEYMISAAIQWKGQSAGPIQEKLVTDRFAKKYNKDVTIKPGFIDISKPSINDNTDNEDTGNTTE